MLWHNLLECHAYQRCGSVLTQARQNQNHYPRCLYSPLFTALTLGFCL